MARAASRRLPHRCAGTPPAEISSSRPGRPRANATRCRAGTAGTVPWHALDRAELMRVPDHEIPAHGPPLPAARELGRALHRCRLERGLSLRALARLVGFAAHSGLVDYERGRRIPPEDLLSAYERAFAMPEGALAPL